MAKKGKEVNKVAKKKVKKVKKASMPKKGKMMMSNMPMSYEDSQRMMRQGMMAKKGMM